MSKLNTWRDRYWSDISDQFLRLNTIHETNFDGSLLKKDTTNGTWLWSWLGRVYNQHSTTARETATIEVIEPGYGTGESWMLRLEVMVRRHQTKSLATFPAAFDILAPAPTSENPSSSVTDVNDGL